MWQHEHVFFSHGVYDQISVEITMLEDSWDPSQDRSSRHFRPDNLQRLIDLMHMKLTALGTQGKKVNHRIKSVCS
jgi:hypothetical protein